MLIQILINSFIIIYGLREFQKKTEPKFSEFKIKLYQNHYVILIYPIILGLFLTNFSQVLIYPIILFIFLKCNTERHTFSFSKSQIILSFKMLAAFWPLAFSISWISHFLFNDSLEQDIVSKIRAIEFSPEFFNYVFIIVVVTPIVEEFCFRKILYRDLKKYVGIFGSAFITSLIFAWIHNNLYSFAVLFILGFLLVYAYEKHGSIVYPILVHAMFNFIMIVFIKL
ncbi:MAG: hypothetical protein CMI23_06150 [Opitutae bacterium]|nr:hypothetical protein [Opitutae bacterium]